MRNGKRRITVSKDMGAEIGAFDRVERRYVCVYRDIVGAWYNRNEGVVE
jgi:hypothetical protein